MKKRITNLFKGLLFTLIIFCSSAYAQQWASLREDDIEQGLNSISSGKSYGNAIATDANGVTYIAYMDNTSANKVIVKKLVNNSWQTVGDFVSEQAVTSFSLAINGTVPYVAYNDGTVQNKITVKFFNSGLNQWEVLGNKGFSAGAGFYISMVIKNAMIYVAYQDAGNFKKAVVKKYANGFWSSIGKEASEGEAQNISLTLDTKDNPVIGYKDLSVAGDKISVRVFSNQFSWQYLGGKGFFSTGTGSIGAHLHVAYLGSVLHLAHANTEVITGKTYHSLEIKQYSTGNNTWTAIGKLASNSTNPITNMKLLMNNNTIYALYIDHSSRAWVQRASYSIFLSKWVWIGLPNTPGPVAPDFGVWNAGITMNNNVPYVIYSDANKRPIVRKFENNGWYNATPFVGVINASNEGGGIPSVTYPIKHPFIDVSFRTIPQIMFSNSAGGVNEYEYNQPSNKWFAGIGMPPNADSYWDYPILKTFMAHRTHMAYNNVDIQNPNKAGAYLSTSDAFIGGHGIGLASKDFQTTAPAAALDKNGNLYVAFGDGTPGGRATVKKLPYDPNGFSTVETKGYGFSKGAILRPSIAVDANNIPYIVYNDKSWGRVILQKYVGLSWVSALNAQPDGIISDAAGKDVSLAIDTTQNVIYVAYIDEASSMARVKKVVNGAVQQLTNPYSDKVHHTQIVIGEDGSLYFACKLLSTQRVIVRKYNPKTAVWTTLGGDISFDPIDDFSLAYRNGVPYIFYISNGRYAFVKQFAACVNPPHTAFIQSSTSVNAGSSVTYKVKPVPDAYGYYWIFVKNKPSGPSATIYNSGSNFPSNGSNQVVIHFSNVAGTGTLYVFPIGNCGLGEPISLPISVEFLNLFNNSVKETHASDLRISPNPFNTVTTITYTVAQAEAVTLKIYTESGKEVATLVNGYKQPGTYNVSFNGSQLNAGIYFCRFQAGKNIAVKKIMIAK